MPPYPAASSAGCCAGSRLCAGARWTLHEAPDARWVSTEVMSFVDEHPAFVLFCPGGGGGQIEDRPAGGPLPKAAQALQARQP